MRYHLYLVKGEHIDVIKTEDLEQYEVQTEIGKLWFSSFDKPELYIYDSRFDFWQQALVTHQDKIRTLGVVRTEYIPPLVRMRHLIG